MACYPWIRPHRSHGQNLDDFPHLKRWFDAIAARPAVRKAYEGAPDAYQPNRTISDEERKILFGQTARPA
jgi:GST-like protein